MEEGFAIWANPSSPHAPGRKAKAALEDARERVARALGWDGEVIFTSGASEALALAFGQAQVGRRIVTTVEHDAVIRAAAEHTTVAILDGRVAADELAAVLADGGPALVAVQAVNSETGTCVLMDGDDALPTIVRDAGSLLLSDCSQSAGKLPLPDADMAVVSAHKLGGPIGIGALLVRDFAMLRPTGGHERGYRGGTENLPGALGFAAALEAGGYDSWATTERQRAAFRDALGESGTLIAPGRQCSHIVSIAAPKLSATAALIRLDAMGFAVSAGSACSSGTMKRSTALAGFGIEPDIADRAIRVSAGWSTTALELERFVEAWDTLNR